MEEEKMILKDLPVDTRNYTIIDNITGKPIDQSNYTLTIDPEVINKLNKLKQINEEKVKQAALRDQYGADSLVSTFTPDNNNVFTPVFNEEYINYEDFNNATKAEAPVQAEETSVVEKAPAKKAQEEIQSNELLGTVTLRDPSERIAEQEAQNQPEPEPLDYITAEDFKEQHPEEEYSADNSMYTPDNDTLQTASEQIVGIDTKKLGQDIKPVKTRRRVKEKYNLDKMEIKMGKGVAWMAYILFFLPLMFKGKNRYVRLHANEGLEINLLEIIGGICLAQYFLLPTFLTLSGVGAIVSLVFCVFGIAILSGVAISIIPLIISAILGVTIQHPFIFPRMIKVPTERMSE